MKNRKVDDQVIELLVDEYTKLAKRFDPKVWRPSALTTLPQILEKRELDKYLPDLQYDSLQFKLEQASPEQKERILLALASEIFKNEGSVYSYQTIRYLDCGSRLFTALQKLQQYDIAGTQRGDYARMNELECMNFVCLTQIGEIESLASQLTKLEDTVNELEKLANEDKANEAKKKYTEIAMERLLQEVYRLLGPFLEYMGWKQQDDKTKTFAERVHGDTWAFDLKRYNYGKSLYEIGETLIGCGTIEQKTTDIVVNEKLCMELARSIPNQKIENFGVVLAELKEATDKLVALSGHEKAHQTNAVKHQQQAEVIKDITEKINQIDKMRQEVNKQATIA